MQFMRCLCLQLAEGGYSFVYLVREQVSPSREGNQNYALKKARLLSQLILHVVMPSWAHLVLQCRPALLTGILIRQVLAVTAEQLADAKLEVQLMSLLSHPNILPLVASSVVTARSQEGGLHQVVYMLFPLYQVHTAQAYTEDSVNCQLLFMPCTLLASIQAHNDKMTEAEL